MAVTADVCSEARTVGALNAVGKHTALSPANEIRITLEPGMQ